MTKHLLLILLICFLISQADAQKVNTWSVIFGTEEFTGLTRKNIPENLASTIVESSDGGFYITGTNNANTSNTPIPNTLGAWIAKFGSDGKLHWWKCPNVSNSYFSPSTMCPTNDGGVVVVGHAGRFANNQDIQGVVIFKFDKDGKLLFENVTKSDKLCENGLCWEQSGMPLYVYITSDGNIKALYNIGINVEKKPEK